MSDLRFSAASLTKEPLRVSIQVGRSGAGLLSNPCQPFLSSSEIMYRMSALLHIRSLTVDEMVVVVLLEAPLLFIYLLIIFANGARKESFPMRVTEKKHLYWSSCKYLLQRLNEVSCGAANQLKTNFSHTFGWSRAIMYRLLISFIMLQSG